MISLDNVDVFYGDKQALFRVSFKANKSELVCIIGANGAGKTTLLRTVAGILKPLKGRVSFDGMDITRMPSNRVIKRGIGYVPEGRELFPDMSVLENILIGSYATINIDKKRSRKIMQSMFEYFPVLKKRKSQLAGTLSGGEQQMLAIARGLMGDPKVLLLDEPSLGLAPIIVDRVFEIIKMLNDQGLTILLVEQNAYLALRVASRGYVLQTGHMYLEGSSETLGKSPEIRRAYMGI